MTEIKNKYYTHNYNNNFKMKMQDKWNVRITCPNNYFSIIRGFMTRDILQ
jgi:hypothetical protein